jgi:transposase
VIPFWKTDHEAEMGRALEIRDDLSAAALRALAAREKKNRAARRMLAIANALEGMSRAAAACDGGMDCQALRDAVVRYNDEGVDGLYDRPASGRPPALTEAELALLSARIFRGPDPETHGVSSWTLPDLCRWI